VGLGKDLLGERVALNFTDSMAFGTAMKLRWSAKVQIRGRGVRQAQQDYEHHVFHTMRWKETKAYYLFRWVAPKGTWGMIWQHEWDERRELVQQYLRLRPRAATLEFVNNE
jgi:hypothetical protein